MSSSFRTKIDSPPIPITFCIGNSIALWHRLSRKSRTSSSSTACWTPSHSNLNIQSRYSHTNSLFTIKSWPIFRSKILRFIFRCQKYSATNSRLSVSHAKGNLAKYFWPQVSIQSFSAKSGASFSKNATNLRIPSRICPVMVKFCEPIILISSVADRSKIPKSCIICYTILETVILKKGTGVFGCFVFVWDMMILELFLQPLVNVNFRSPCCINPHQYRICGIPS